MELMLMIPCVIYSCRLGSRFLQPTVPILWKIMLTMLISYFRLRFGLFHSLFLKDYNVAFEDRFKSDCKTESRGLFRSDLCRITRSRNSVSFFIPNYCPCANSRARASRNNPSKRPFHKSFSGKNRGLGISLSFRSLFSGFLKSSYWTPALVHVTL
jgi:hypothetical protein